MKTCPTCYSCGMPMKTAADFAVGDQTKPFCSHCSDEKGNLKPYEEILSGTANYLSHAQGIDQAAAYKVANEMLKSLPAWKEANHG